jgi:hypothetical protein
MRKEVRGAHGGMLFLHEGAVIVKLHNLYHGQAELGILKTAKKG